MHRPGLPEFPIGQQEQGPMAHQGAADPTRGIEYGTMEGLDLAIEQGARAIECDLTGAGDGTVFVHHGTEHTRATIGRMNAAQVAVAFPDAPRLEELITSYKSRGIFINADLENPEAAKHAPKVVADLDALGLFNFASFNSGNLVTAAKVLGDGHAATGYQMVSMSGSLEDAQDLVAVTFNGNPAARRRLEESPASRLQLPYELVPAKHDQGRLLQSVLGIDVGELPHDDEGESALMDILMAGAFDPEITRNALVTIKVSQAMIELAEEEFGIGVDIWTLEHPDDIRHAARIGARWLITKNVPDTFKAIEEHSHRVNLEPS